jgi:hypothetical protein
MAHAKLYDKSFKCNSIQRSVWPKGPKFMKLSIDGAHYHHPLFLKLRPNAWSDYNGLKRRSVEQKNVYKTVKDSFRYDENCGSYFKNSGFSIEKTFKFGALNEP